MYDIAYTETKETHIPEDVYKRYEEHGVKLNRTHIDVAYVERGVHQCNTCNTTLFNNTHKVPYEKSKTNHIFMNAYKTVKIVEPEKSHAFKSLQKLKKVSNMTSDMVEQLESALKITREVFWTGCDTKLGYFFDNKPDPSNRIFHIDTQKLKFKGDMELSRIKDTIESLGKKLKGLENFPRL